MAVKSQLIAQLLGAVAEERDACTLLVLADALEEAGDERAVIVRKKAELEGLDPHWRFGDAMRDLFDYDAKDGSLTLGLLSPGQLSRIQAARARSWDADIPLFESKPFESPPGRHRRFGGRNAKERRRGEDAATLQLRS